MCDAGINHRPANQQVCFLWNQERRGLPPATVSPVCQFRNRVQHLLLVDSSMEDIFSKELVNQASHAEENVHLVCFLRERDMSCPL
jgi:hypothetical protein